MVKMAEQQGAQLQGKHLSEQLFMHDPEDVPDFAASNLIHHHKGDVIQEKSCGALSNTLVSMHA